MQRWHYFEKTWPCGRWIRQEHGITYELFHERSIASSKPVAVVISGRRIIFDRDFSFFAGATFDLMTGVSQSPKYEMWTLRLRRLRYRTTIQKPQNEQACLKKLTLQKMAAGLWMMEAVDIVRWREREEGVCNNGRCSSEESYWNIRSTDGDNVALVGLWRWNQKTRRGGL